MSAVGYAEHTRTTRARNPVECEWCGEEIKASEAYSSWLWYDGRKRQTVYAHAECAKAWQAEGGWTIIPGRRRRPVVTGDEV